MIGLSTPAIGRMAMLGMLLACIVQAEPCHWSGGWTFGPENAGKRRSFTLSVQCTEAESRTRGIDLALVIDLSASQQGDLFQQTVASARDYIDRLEGGSRAQILVSMHPEEALLERPAAVGSQALTQAMESLRQVSPRGIVEIEPIVQALESWLTDRSGQLPKRILLLGDFDQATSWPSADRRKRFEDHLIAGGISVSYHPVDGGWAPEEIRRWVEQTDGESPDRLPAHRDRGGWRADLERPVLTELRMVPGPASRFVAPEEITGRELRRGILLLGWSEQFPVTIEAHGRRDGEVFQKPLSFSTADAGIEPKLEMVLSGVEAFPTLWSEGGSPSSLRGLQGRLTRLAPRLRKEAELARQRGEAPVADPFLTWLNTLEPASSPKGEEKSETPLDQAKARAAINKQKLIAEVNASLDQARKSLERDPSAATERLKRTLQYVQAATQDADLRSKLERRIESALKGARTEQRRQQAEALSREQALAASDARQLSAARAVTQEDRRQAILNRYRSLLAEGATADARELAEQASQESPGELPPQAALLQSTFADRYARIESIEFAKQKGFWDSLASAEQSSVPIPDRPEIVFPDARRWEELSARRAKYKQADVREISPKEQQIRSALQKSITVDFKEMPLREVVEYLKELLGVSVVLDLQGLDEVGLDPEEPITLALDSIPAKSVLALLLEPLELSSLVRDDVLFITSRDRAESRLETRVYYVADLVIPIGNFNGGGVGLNGQLQTTGQGQTGQGGIGNAGQGNGLGNFQGPAGNGGNAGNLRNDLSDELKQILQQVIDRQADATEPAFWDPFFAKGRATNRDVRAMTSTLLRAGRHREIIALVTSYRHHGRLGSWAYEAELFSRAAIDPRDPTLEALAMSIVDANPNDLENWRRAARLLALVGRSGQGAALLRRQQASARPSVSILYEALLWGIDAGDVDGVVWASERLLGRDWPTRHVDPARATRQQLARFESQLRAEGNTQGADQIRAVAPSLPEKDLTVTLSWEGEADLDLSVIEPTRFYCHPLTPETLGGGVLRADQDEGSEVYSATMGIPGEYEIRVEKIWGEPTAGWASIDIVWHQGTPRERRERRTITWKDEPIARTTLQLDEGRRRTLAAASEPESFSLTADDRKARAQLRRTLAASTTGDSAGGGGVVPFALAQGSVAAGGGAVAFDPVVTPIPDGVNLQAQAVVSADRRFVRMTLVPIVQSIESVSDVRVFNAVGPPTNP